MSTGSGLVPPPPAIRPSASAETKPKPKLQRIQMRASYRGKSIQIDLDPVTQEVYTWQALKSKVWNQRERERERERGSVEITTKYLINFVVWCMVSLCAVFLFYNEFL